MSTFAQELFWNQTKQNRYVEGFKEHELPEEDVWQEAYHVVM